MQRSNLKPSKAVIDDLEKGTISYHEYSYLFRCNNCDWWCIREKWADAEWHRDLDYLVTGVAGKWDLSDKHVPILILQEYFKKKKRTLIESGILTGDALGQFIEDALSNEYKSCKANHIATTIKSDIFLLHDTEKWLIQVKWENTGSEFFLSVIKCINGILRHDQKEDEILVTSVNPCNLKKVQSLFSNKAFDYSLVKLNEINKLYDVYPAQLIHPDRIWNIVERESDEQSEPWEKVHEDEKLYYDALALPERFGLIFGKKKT